MKRRCGEGRAQSAQEIPTRDQRHFRESAFKPRRRPMRMVRRLSLVVVTVVLLASLPVAAQQPVAPPPPQIPYGTPISLEQAKKAVAAAEAESRKNHWNMVIAVLDTGGHLVMLERMDGVQLGSIGAAEDKAYSAVMYRRPTKVFQDLVAQGGANIRLLGLRGARSEEHTSELQSLAYLVCRLLL